MAPLFSKLLGGFEPYLPPPAFYRSVHFAWHIEEWDLQFNVSCEGRQCAHIWNVIHPDFDFMRPCLRVTA